MITINTIAKHINGTVFGDGELKVTSMAPPALVEEDGITFASNEPEIEQLRESRAACVITTINTRNYPKTVIRVKDLKLAMTIIYNLMLEIAADEKGVIHPSAIVSKDAVLGKNVSIGPNSVIGRAVRIGDNSIISANCVIGDKVSIGRKTKLYPGVVIYNSSVIGNKVTIHSGTVIGSDGFGYINQEGKTYKVPQMARAVIEDNVEIGANSCIDRGTFADTVIGKGSKLDNHVQVAHNVKLGQNVMIAAQSGIGGSATVGENTLMGGQTGVSDHVHIGKNVKMGAKTGAISDFKDNMSLFGYPAAEATYAKKFHAFLKLLFKNSKKIRKFVRGLPED